MRVFVYGTLKQSQPAHSRYCGGCLAMQPATVPGRLYLSHTGYPMLVVPQSAILAMGTADRAADLEVEQRAAQSAQDQAAGETDSDVSQLVQGELLSFDPDPRRLALLDAYEDFKPGERSLYHRVLVQAQVADGIVPAWTYVTPSPPPEPFAKQLGTCWP